jgi:hypothetical protein
MHHPEEIIAHVNKEQETDCEKFVDKSTGLEMEEPQPLLEWSAEKYKDFGANLEFVTNRSQESAQFDIWPFQLHVVKIDHQAPDPPFAKRALMYTSYLKLRMTSLSCFYI